MKRIIYLFFILINICSCFSEENIIWGMWNIGEKEHAIDKRVSSMGRYKSTDYALLFDPDHYYYGGPRITYDDSYLIKEVIHDEKDKNIIYLILEYKQYQYIYGDRVGEPEILEGKVAMHFIDKDHMWLEVVWDDSEYPTDSSFPDGYFQGPSEIFWRAEKQD